MIGERRRADPAREPVLPKVIEGRGRLAIAGIYERAARLARAFRRVGDQVGMRLHKDAGKNDATGDHDDNSAVHGAARQASFQSPPGGGKMTSIRRPLAVRCGSAFSIPTRAALPC